MIRREEINNAKEAFYKRILQENYYYDPRDCFEEGAEWADANPKNPWISVEDDLPCNHEELMAKRLFSYEKETVHVLTLLPDGDIVIDFMVHNRGKWKWWSHHRPTHWFPIPELPKE